MLGTHRFAWFALACLLALALPLCAQPEMLPDAVQRLIMQLADPDAAVRASAIAKLRANDERVTAPLLGALKDPAPAVRKAAAESLAACASYEWMRARLDPAVAALTDALKDTEPSVRISAVLALANLKDHARPATRRRNALPNVPLATDNVPATIRPLLDDPDPDVRTVAALALARWEKTIPPGVVVAGLQAQDPAIRRDAAEMLQRRPDPQAMEPLLALLHDPEAAVRIAVINALGAMENRRAVDALLPLVEDRDGKVRQASLLALRTLAGPGLKDARLFDAVSGGLRDPLPSIRISTARLLGELRDERAELKLIDALDDPDANVYNVVSTHLFRLVAPSRYPEVRNIFLPFGGEPAEVDPDVRQLMQAAIDPALLPEMDVNRQVVNPSAQPAWIWSEESITKLIAMLENPRARARRAAALLLAEIGVPRAVEPITRLALDADPDLRRAALGALFKLNPDGRVELLCGAAEDPDPTVREIAAVGLRLCHAPGATNPELLAPRAVDALLALLRDANLQVCKAAIQGLSAQDDPRVREAMLGLLSDPRETVPAAVVSYYHPRITDPRAVEPLLALLKKAYQRQREADNPGWQPLIMPDSVEFALLRMGRPAEERLLVALTDPDADLRLAAVRVLGMLRDAWAAEPMTALLRDTNAQVRRETARALGDLGNPSAVEPLRAALKDGDPTIRAEAAVSLALLGKGDGFEQALAMATAPRAEWGTRERALRALKRLRDPRAIDPMLAMLQTAEEWQIRGLIFDVLAATGDARAADALIALLGDAHHRSAAITALGKLGDARAVEPLLPYVHGGNAILTIDALTSLRDPRACEPIILAYREKTDGGGGGTFFSTGADGMMDEKKRASIRALFAIGLPALEKTIALLADPRPEARLSAADVLADMPDARAVPALLTLSRDTDWQLRAFAARALGEIRDARAVDPLCALLTDANPAARREAARALGLIADARAREPLLPLLQDADPRVQREAAVALAGFGETTAAPALARAVLTGTDPARQWETLEALAKVKDGCDGAALMTALLDRLRKGDEPAYGIPDVARHLKGQVFEPLRQALADENRHVREQAICGLGYTGDLRAADLLLPLLGDADPQIKGVALYTLGSMKDARALEPALQCLAGTNQYLRSAALNALAELRDARAVEPIIALLRGTGEDRLYAVLALRHLDDPRVKDALLQVLREERAETDTFRQSALALGKFGDQRAAPLLWDALMNRGRETMPFDVPRAVGLLKDREAAPLLIPLLEKIPWIAEEVATALGGY